MYIPAIRQDVKVSLYFQIYESIKEEILRGRLVPGEHLPSKRVLASSLGVSINTIDAAYQQLVSEGYLEARPGSGYYVLDPGVLPVKDMTIEADSSDSHPPCPDNPILDFSPNGVDLPALPLDKIRKCIRDVFADPEADLFRACGSLGSAELRSSLCRYLGQSRGIDCRPEQILIGAGTDYILQLLIQIISYAKSPTRVAMENPVYNKAYQIFTGLGVPVDLIPLDKSGIEMKSLSTSPANIVYTTPAHQFPLGIIMPISRRTELLEWAALSDDRYIIEDDYDSEFRYAGRPIPPIKAMDAANRVIYLGTFSKSIAPSVRISYLVLPPILMQVCQTGLSYYNTTVTGAEQIILSRFIDNGDFERHINRMRTLYRKKRDLFLHSLAPYRSQLDISGTDAGHHLLCRVKNGMSEEDLIANARNAATKVYGISAYYLKETGEKSVSLRIPPNTVLLGYAGLSDREIINGVGALARAWNLSASPGSQLPKKSDRPSRDPS